MRAGKPTITAAYNLTSSSVYLSWRPPEQESQPTNIYIKLLPRATNLNIKLFLRATNLNINLFLRATNLNTKLFLRATNLNIKLFLRATKLNIKLFPRINTRDHQFYNINCNCLLSFLYELDVKCIKGMWLLKTS